MQNTPQVDKLRWLTLTPELLSQEMAQVAGRISYVGGMLADAREELLRAEHERKREESACYLLARAALEATTTNVKGEAKAPTEKQIDAYMRTNAPLAQRLLAAMEREAVAEARVETLRADYAAVKVEADLIAEVARNQRAEMQNLNPTVYAQPRLGAYSAPAPIAAVLGDPVEVPPPAPQKSPTQGKKRSTLV